MKPKIPQYVDSNKIDITFKKKCEGHLSSLVVRLTITRYFIIGVSSLQLADTGGGGGGGGGGMVSTYSCMLLSDFVTPYTV